MLQDHWWPEVGGGPNHVRDLSESIEQAGHEVDVYTRALRSGGELYDSREQLGEDIDVVRRGPTTEFHNPIGRITTTLSIVPWSSLSKYDIIHTHTFLPAVSGKLASLISGTPVVLTVHGTAIPSGVGLSNSGIRNKIEREIEKVLLLRLNYNYVISVNQEHLDLLSPKHKNIEYIPNGVDIDRFQTDGKDSGYVLYLGRLAREKRVGDLISAFCEIANEHEDLELVIVGDGPERENLEQAARETPFAGRIQFKGRVPDKEIPEYYSRASVFVLPSIWEGHPLTLLEAWASKTPVVTTNVEGIREFVKHERNGYLVEPKSPDEIAEGIRFLIENQNLKEQIIEKAYSEVVQEFSWESAAQETIRVYREIIDGY
ncbi:glycosyltransferase family 4 protein [Natrinema thermotolerans]|uniref:Glycosyltransferase family 4 protein n=1 Tax=Natrinema thermotolerans TaxID=121872 RepID=A0AAF0SZB3_9EURY|nr:glycosyltransferase family 4 protein [Natrinema thermotolerans]WMT07484.1 glycosyltransferase family 4 protein [Natrinema thermotolerans]WMT08116.1 glycosyltransferase family 4 protein [Natrinema thermotolerans]